MTRRVRYRLLAAALVAAAPIVAHPAIAGQDRAPRAEPAASRGTLAGGAKWAAMVPERWNGTLLLFSRGYSQRPDVEVAPPALRQALLDAGYAVAASDYGSGGWALAEAVPAQRATVAAFADAHGAPRRVIGWGTSMGGLVTTALAEEERPVIAAGLSLCSSMGGAVGMMNMALDGATAFRTLAAPDAGIELTGITDDRANAERVAAALKIAEDSPAGLARIALSGVLAGIPGWTRAASPQPADDDVEAQAREIAAGIVRGVYLPRADQERRAGGVFSWTSGVDYRRQLDRSGRRPLVAALYARAGLDLDADLARLNAAPRTSAQPGAVAYMMRHYTPNARPLVPLLAVQAVGDGLTSPSLQRAYTDAAPARMAAGLWVREAHHCAFRPATVLAALKALETRLQDGRWPARPNGFVVHTPPPMLRPCVRGGACR